MRIFSSAKLALHIGIALIGTLLAPGLARGQTTESAKDDVVTLVRQGMEARASEDFGAAYRAYSKAWKLREHAVIAASLAEVECELKMYLHCAEHWQYYLDNLPEDPVPDRATAEKHLQDAREHLARLAISIDGPPALFFLNRELLLWSGSPVWIRPGEHIFHAERGFTKTRDFVFEVEAGETHAIAVSFPEHDPEPSGSSAPMPDEPAEPSAPPKESESNARAIVVIGGAALSVVALGVAGVYYLQTSAAEDRAFELLDEVNELAEPGQSPNSVCASDSPPAKCHDLREAWKERDSDLNILTASLITGTALAVATTVTYFAWPDSDEKAEAEQANLSISPWVRAQTGGLTLQGSF